MQRLVNEAYLPATLTVPPMNDDQFADFCADYPDLQFEMTAEGNLLVLPPTFSGTGAIEFEVALQLGIWARNEGTGICCSPSARFVLPNSARRSPDASWTRKSRIQALSAQRNSFWHLCPDFVLEIKSSTDRLKPLQAKMREYITQGAELGWLIDPAAKSVEIYRPNAEPQLLSNIDSLAAEAPLTGFVLDLCPIWNPLAG